MAPWEIPPGEHWDVAGRRQEDQWFLGGHGEGTLGKGLRFPEISPDFTWEKWGISPWHMGNVDGFWPSNGIYGAFKKRVLIIKHLGGFTMFHLGWVFAVFNLAFESLDSLVWWILSFLDLAVCQNLVPLVNIKIAGKWMFIPLKMVLIGIDPYPFVDA